MRIVTLLCIALSLVFTVSSARDAADSTAAFFNTKYNPKADPFRQLDSAKVEAAKTGRQILLDVGGEWCIWCHRMDDLFRANPDLADLLTKHYVILKINMSMDNKNEVFLAQFPKIDGYPHLFVLDAAGKLVQSQNTGDLEEGKGHSKEKMAEFLKKWAKKK